MDDRFQAMLARQLSAYADARVRPIDPVRVAAAAVVSPPRRRATLLPEPWLIPARAHWSVLVAGAILALGAALVLVTGGGHPVTAPPTNAPSGSTSPIASDAAGVDLRLSILENAAWPLDYAASGLDPRVDPGIQGEMASSIRFTDGRFDGGTGYGGGCDLFKGTFTIQGDGLRLTFETLRQACGKGSPQQIVERLVATRRFALTGCTGPLDGPSPNPGLRCGTLTLFPDSGIGLLVYGVQ